MKVDYLIGVNEKKMTEIVEKVFEEHEEELEELIESNPTLSELILRIGVMMGIDETFWETPLDKLDKEFDKVGRRLDRRYGKYIEIYKPEKK